MKIIVVACVLPLKKALSKSYSAVEALSCGSPFLEEQIYTAVSSCNF